MFTIIDYTLVLIKERQHMESSGTVERVDLIIIII